jgi:uncharacterized protein (TIGR02145 family)
MKENLKSLHDAIGNSITRYCYNNEIDSCAIYGGLYSWNTLMNGEESVETNPSGVQGICPNGWHVPSVAEWTELSEYLGGNSVAGGKLKEIGTLHWKSPNSEATNESEFTAFAGGYRSTTNTFASYGYNGNWWSSTENNATSSWWKRISYGAGTLSTNQSGKELGISVRCIKD